MKVKLKAAFSAIVVLMIMFLLKSVSAVDSVYQVIYHYNNAKRRTMLYRVITQPYSGTLDNFRAYNEFVTEVENKEPDYLSYSSEYIIFTKDLIGNYTNSRNNRVFGYMSYIPSEDNVDSLLSTDIKAFKIWLEKLETETSYPVSIGNDAFYTYNGANVTGENFSNTAFANYNKNVIDVGQSISLSPLFSWSSPLTASDGTKIVNPVYNSTEINGLVKWRSKREMLYTENEQLIAEGPRKGQNTTGTYYIMDIELNNSVTNKLIEYVEANSAGDDKWKEIRVSAIASTMNSKDDPTKFYALTPGALMYSKLGLAWGDHVYGWSDGMLGKTNDAMNSALNLWDNILRIPLSAEQDKEIVVNHIAVIRNSNGKVAEYKLLDEEEYGGSSLQVGNSDTKYNVLNDSVYIDRNGKIVLDSGVTKLLKGKSKTDNDMMKYSIVAPNNETYYRAEIKKLSGDYDGYRFKKSVIDKDTKIEYITDDYIENKYSADDESQTVENGKEVRFNIGSNDTEVIVNLYYELPMQEVQIEHKYCEDKDLKKCHNIEGNRTISTGIQGSNSETELVYNEVNLVEKYYVRENSWIEASSLTEGVYEYSKYDITNGVAHQDTTKDKVVTVRANDISKLVNITFYYLADPNAQGGNLGGNGNASDSKTVVVEHKLCKDDSLRNCETIAGNRKISVNGSYMEYKGTDLKEEYTGVKKSATVSADSVERSSATLKKYTIITTNGGIKTITVTNQRATATTNDNSSVIAFTFYYLESGSNEPSINKVIESQPKIDVPGQLGIESAAGVSTNCSDGRNSYTSVPTNAKDGKDDIYVGIKDTPIYVLAGINVEKLKIDDQNVTINVNISFGGQEKKFKIEVPYSLSYYAIQNLLMYKYEYADIYNAGQANTKGNSLFENNRFSITPTGSKSLTLYSAIKDKITNSQAELNNWKNYLKTSYKTQYTVPTTNPKDTEENSSGRKYMKFNLYMGYNYSEKWYNSPYTEVDNSVNEYITTNNLAKDKYTEIELTGSTTISINLLNKETFNKIDKNKDGEITFDDLNAFESNTDKYKSSFDSAKDALGGAESAYYNACTDAGYAFPCKSSVEKRKNEEKELCEESECGDCDENGENCRKCEWNSSDCPTHYKWQNTYNNVSRKASDWTNAEESYDRALDNLKTAYKAELYAIQHFDEVYYIQENLWKVYKNYTNEDIAKLLGLNVKFEYSSGNAKLENTDLMTITEQSKVLESNNKQALSGELKGDTCKKQELAAERQYLTASQKDYYTSGITATNVSAVTEYNKKGTSQANTYKIPIDKLNGTRILAGIAYYSIDNTATAKVGSSKTIEDNMYYDYSYNEKNNEYTSKIFYVNNNSKFTKDYGVAEKNSQEFNVYTPLVVSTTVNQDIDIIDQTQRNNYNNVDVIQANSKFTIKFDNSYSVNTLKKVYSNSPSDFTTRYKQVTYIKFEFAVTNVRYKNANGFEMAYGNYDANEWIGPIYSDYITAVPYLNTVQGESITDTTYHYYVIAAAINTKDSWTKQLLDYIDTSLDDLENTSLINTLYNACGTEGGQKLSYYADLDNSVNGNDNDDKKGGTLIIVNRTYDFRVTDLKDIDWKEVFRNNTSSSYVNQHSGIAYYAGLTKWNTKNPTVYNQIIGRTQDEIGTSSTRILPLGPYKNTNTSYTSAPKMGYRFSFDLKVTGDQNKDKYVEIIPSFYYISKDGKNFYTEYSSGEGGIYLFYKNNNGKYVRVGSSSDTYKIQFTPNDGYRSLIQADIKNLNSNVVTLGNLKKIVLKFNETTTTSRNDAAITYYGEYKLPNSTIAVYVDKNGKYNVNTPLTNGYIGVVFDIQAYEDSGVVLEYGKNSYKGQTNTSQWDYEGYLGIANPGSEYSTTMKLEKGTWKIDNNTYNKIKGTVILYDTDSKASNDFN